MSKMNYELRDLLRQLSEENRTVTHYTHFGPDGVWSIPNQNLTQFWEQYCKLVHDQLTNEDDQRPHDLCLSEMPTTSIPLIQEFVFKFQHDDDDHEWEPYDDLFLAWLCYLYQTILLKYFNLQEERDLMVVVLESKNCWIEKHDDDQFMIMKVRIQFPYARIDTKIQDHLIRHEMITMLRRFNILSKMSRQPIGDWDSIMSKNISTTPIMLYGSTTLPTVPPLKEIHFWNKITKDLLDEDQLPDEIENLNDAFLIKYHEHVRNNTVDKRIFDHKVETEYWLPMFLSTHYGSNTLLIRQEMNKKSKFDPIEIKPFGSNRSKFDQDDEENLEMARKLLTMLSQERYTHESWWLDIGKALYHVSKGHGDGLQLWIKNTIQQTKDCHLLYLEDGVHAQHEDAVKEICTQLYDTFGQSCITLKTLGFYAREDNKQMYDDWHYHWVILAMEKATSCLDSDVADALYKLFWLDFTYDIQNDKWYIFDDFGWIETKKGIELRKKISNQFLKRFELIRTDLNKMISDMPNGDDKNQEKTNHEANNKKLSALIAKLKISPFKKRLMEEAIEKFANIHFSEHLNKNPKLTGVKNGVLEIINNDIIFRCAKPEDYITLCANVPFNDYFHWKHKLVVRCMTWLEQVFPDESLLHYFLKFSSSFFIGRNNDKIFAIFTGNGDNSKSMIIKLYEQTFGKYIIKMTVSVLSEKSGHSGNATPQFARAAGARGCILDEADDTVQLNTAALKRLTGGDRFYARKLGENGDDIELTFKTIMSANDIPNMTRQKAVEARVKIVPFLSQWVETPPDSEEERYKQRLFQMNTNFENEIPVLTSAFLWILTQYYPKYATEGLKTPDIVIEHTENYWKENDYVGLFISECIYEVYVDDAKQIRDTKSIITLNQINEAFRVWYRQCYPNRNIPEREALRKDLYNRWGKTAKGWPGFALMKDKDDSKSIFDAN
ncbi:MAG TPA: hypothetical protein VLG50_05195 [Candidatus Saccharimonadales bacterium]|nr:hypothetical protein [Candidatus Saccharimonadales bacterium]